MKKNIKLYLCSACILASISSNLLCMQKQIITQKNLAPKITIKTPTEYDRANYDTLFKGLPKIPNTKEIIQKYVSFNYIFGPIIKTICPGAIKHTNKTNNKKDL